ncbi:D-alanine--poly(phosphoribitol) ligase subunit DltA [Clostridium beijerinckii]|uniref:D-alanine--D-alanyl carrier protein ligase n=1 Tax=Clostridium beijerinckii TaxID=1520 RepID=A0A1S8RN88_CLOBE|nr:D-alanine--poly(phosphoribitol) ligase subunit DltA [Clostridium beijerinckii]NMF03216.1 D-alanine--poly(phosphoribitol) ligase subunit DltA [Clostridium beijerinckii]NRY60128.1 D-alanine--poly(phosphoribitol) ligase subunit 1 [Clostridium beijerinckii]OOM54630.1 D-alanine--poly(phosphoribitol) ligase subunit 1 [Clostridium beijerinckii]
MKILEGIKKYSNSNRIALKCDGNVMTYGELDTISECIAAFLLREFKDDRTPIIIYGNKENLMMAVMMAALKSGRAYIPIDISYPKERVEAIISEVHPKVLIDFSKESNFEGIRILKDKDIEEIVKEYKDVKVEKENWVKEDENAYILFTSGSTGKPKGVQISSNNLDNFVEWIAEYLNLDEKEEVFMNQAAYSFDLSVTSIYPGLCYGKTLHGFSKETLSNLKNMFDDMRKSDINIWVSTPSFAGMCVAEKDFNSTMLQNLKAMIFVGEVLPKPLCEELINRFPGTRVVNGYGPTEATVAVSANDMSKDLLLEEGSLPIGYPMKTSVVKIVDDEGNVLGDGEKGEIVIVGPSVSKGYFNNEQATAKAFFYDDYNGSKCRAYRTGDLGYYVNGNLYYCGRKDFQIKLNGFRIEIEDIENNLVKVSNIKNAAVVPIEKDGKIAYLTAFIELKEDNGLSGLKNGIMIKKELANLIPSYMVPRNIKIVKQFPTNVNGKIDRKKLLEEV